jgi:transposase
MLEQMRNEPTGPMQRVEERLGEPLGEWLRQRYAVEGLSSTEIGRRLGLHAGTVVRWLRHFGIEPRFPGQRGRAS